MYILLTPKHLPPGVTWVAVDTADRKGVVGSIVRRGKGWHTGAVDGVGEAGGPYGSREEAALALVRASERAKRRKK